VVAIYAVLTVATIAVLRRFTKARPVPEAPQESDVEEYTVI
jgi:cytochrome bd ubiquinol oxidase subunit I